MGKAQRDKGKRREREAAAVLREQTDLAWRRSSQNRGAPDAPDLLGPPGLACEVKGRQTVPGYLYDWLDDTRDKANPDDVPFVMMRANGSTRPWLFVLEAEDLRQLLERLRLSEVDEFAEPDPDDINRARARRAAEAEPRPVTSTAEWLAAIEG